VIGRWQSWKIQHDRPYMIWSWRNLCAPQLVVGTVQGRYDGNWNIIVSSMNERNGDWRNRFLGTHEGGMGMKNGRHGCVRHGEPERYGFG
jgi:hypothetical protein